MLLNVWDSIRDFFVNLFSSVSWTSLLTLFTGIVIGILICLMVYLVFLFKSVKSKEKENSFDASKININNLNISKEEEAELIRKYIESSKSQFKEESEELSFSDKLNVLKDVSVNLAVDVAKIYYPKSQHPLLELSVDELIKLDYYIMQRVERIFEGKILKHFKKIKVSFIMNMLDKKKMIEESKIVKTAKKLNVGGIGAVIKNALNIVNPVHWVKKAAMNMTMEIAYNRIFGIVFEIVGEETAKIYSKNAFVIFNEEEQELLLEKEIEEEIKVKE